MTNEITGKTINTIRALRVAGWKVHRIANFFGLEPWKVAKIARPVAPMKIRRNVTFIDYPVDFNVIPIDKLFR